MTRRLNARALRAYRRRIGTFLHLWNPRRGGNSWQHLPELAIVLRSYTLWRDARYLTDDEVARILRSYNWRPDPCDGRWKPRHIITVSFTGVRPPELT